MLFSLPACQPETPAAPYVSNVVAYAPLPGTNAAVAYLDLANPGDQAIVLQNVSSPQFAQAEMHETELVDGVARMRKMHELIIAAEATQEFAPSGKHVMLLQSTVELSAGLPVTLSFEFDTGNTMTIVTDLQTRPVE